MRKQQAKHSGTFRAGERYNKWTVISDVPVFVKDGKGSRHNRAMVSVKCDCGQEGVVRPTYLRNSHGCYDCTRAKQGKDNPCWKGVGDLCSLEYSRLKRQAANRNIDFGVTKEYVWDLFEQQNGLCAVSGLPIELVPTYYIKKGKTQTASLDRIDSSRGYVEGNVQWVHKDVNVMKNGYNSDYFIKICKAIADKNKNVDVREAVSTFKFGFNKETK